MDFNQFVAGLRQMGLPNEQAIYLAYAVAEGIKSPELPARIGTFGMQLVDEAVKAVEKRA